MKFTEQVLIKMSKEQKKRVEDNANKYQLPMGAYLRAKVFNKIPLKVSYKRPSKKQIKASLDYLRALAEKDFKPKDYEYIWTGDLTDKLT